MRTDSPNSFRSRPFIVRAKVIADLAITLAAGAASSAPHRAYSGRWPFEATISRLMSRVKDQPAAFEYAFSTMHRILLGPGWLERKQTLKPSAYRPLEIAWRVHVEPVWGKYPITKIVFTDVQAWVTILSIGDAKAVPVVKPKSATTVIRAYGVLAAILDDAVKDRRFQANPARGVDLPRKSKKEHVFLSHEQVRDLADSSKYPALIRVLAHCGLRWGEVTGLRVQDVDMIRRRLNVNQNAVDVGGKIRVGTPKSHERRSVPFPEFLAPAIGEACKDKHREDLVFPNEDGSYLRAISGGSGRGSWFLKAVQRAGIPRVTPHDLRHTAASFAVSAGANVKAVQ